MPETKEHPPVRWHGTLSDIQSTTGITTSLETKRIPKPPQRQAMDDDIEIEDLGSLRAIQDMANCLTDTAIMGGTAGAAATCIPLLCFGIASFASKKEYKKTSYLCCCCATLFSIPGAGAGATISGCASCFTFPAVAYMGEPECLPNGLKKMEDCINKAVPL